MAAHHKADYLVLVAYALTMAAWLNVSQAGVDRAHDDSENTLTDLPAIPEPPTIAPYDQTDSTSP